MTALDKALIVAPRAEDFEPCYVEILSDGRWVFVDVDGCVVLDALDLGELR